MENSRWSDTASQHSIGQLIILALSEACILPRCWLGACSVVLCVFLGPCYEQNTASFSNAAGEIFTMDNEAHELLPKAPEIIENRETTRLRSHESLQVVKRQGDASYASRSWSSVMSIFEDKPYEIRETWPVSIWYLTKRLLTLTILIG